MGAKFKDHLPDVLPDPPLPPEASDPDYFRKHWEKIESL